MEHQGAYARRVLLNLLLDGGQQRARRRTELPDAQATDGSGVEDPATDAVEALETEGCRHCHAWMRRRQDVGNELGSHGERAAYGGSARATCGGVAQLARRRADMLV